MVLISSYEFSNSFRLNYFSEDEQETYLLNLFKILSKLSKETVVREWQLYDIKTEDIEKYFEDADLKYKIHELKVSDLKKICEHCVMCDLAKTRDKVVFGSGNPKADIVLIGEAPGADEDASGLPFVGRAGKFLTQIMEKI